MRLFGRRAGPPAGDPARAGESAEEAEVGRRIDAYAARLRPLTAYAIGRGVRDVGYLPTTERVDGGYPFYRVEGGRYVLAAYERGRDHDRGTFETLDELLYAVFSSVTFSLATTWEVEHRIEGRDSRRAWFPLQEEMMAALEPAWGERLRAEHAQVLCRSPYDDSSDR